DDLGILHLRPPRMPPNTPVDPDRRRLSCQVEMPAARRTGERDGSARVLAEDLPGPRYVLVHLFDERLRRVELLHVAQAAHEVQADPLAVEILVGVQHERLDPPLPAGERRVGADGHRGLAALFAVRTGTDEPA